MGSVYKLTHYIVVDANIIGQPTSLVVQYVYIQQYPCEFKLANLFALLNFDINIMLVIM